MEKKRAFSLMELFRESKKMASKPSNLRTDKRIFYSLMEQELESTLMAESERHMPMERLRILTDKLD
jgi:hypothetical protein